MTNITSRSLAISWSYPENDKGNLTAYILDITVNGVCEQKFIYVYNTVNKSSLPSNVSCSNISYIQHNLREHVNQNITDLQPYTNYTVTVIPYNSQVGEQEQQTYQTLTEGTCSLLLY
ncbi:hypothetical protein SNE40_019867 [Patella caerulea]|uniref:Fibronectin type-III domain-containing protein n=1 Tax=Patella caerulea TaxID=87958 RepID=A0AAN8G6G4_PATCE